jgi:adenylate cyclase
MTPRGRPVRDLVVKLLGGIGAAALIVALAISGRLEPVENWSLDRVLFEFVRGPRPPVTPVVIVTLDESSIDELAAEDVQWPFPRAMHAELIDKISAGSPLAIAFDIFFDTPSSRGAADDDALGRAIARAGNVILGAAGTHDDQPVDSRFGYTRHASNLPIPVIRRGAAAVGTVNLIDDPSDGHLRRAPLAAVNAGDQPVFPLDVELHRFLTRRGLATAPLPHSPAVLINFRGAPGTFPWLPYHRVLRGEIPPEVFRGRVVLIGATGRTLHDLFATAFARRADMPGVEVHANVLDTYVRGDAIQEVPPWVSTTLAAIAGILGAWLVVRLRAFRALIVVLLSWGALTGLACSTFYVWDVWMRGMAVTFALALGYFSTVVGNYIREQRQKRQLSQFFSPAVRDAVVRRGSETTLRPSRRRLTVLFTDIRGFTSISERLEPEQVQEMLGEYLTEMTDVVFRHGGTVDKYIGDCVMALYNAPLEDPNHAANAIRTALELQERTLAVSAKWEERLDVKIRNGVGINTGDAVVGAMGSRQRREYTAISDTVNVASRLESLTKEKGAAVIISESTYAEVKGQFLMRQLDEVTVKGKTQPVKIYAVLPSDVRKYPRAALQAAAQLVAVEGGRSCLVKTRDISEGGLAVTDVPKDWITGSKVRIRCEGGGLPTPLLADGVVIWRHEDAAGIAFTALPPDAAATLGEHMDSAADAGRVASNERRSLGEPSQGAEPT